MRVVYVHGACVTDGAWWWHRMVEPLAAHWLDTRAVELTSAGTDVAELGDLYDDIAATRAVLEDTDEPTIVVAHSYGGMVVTEAAAGLASVRRLVYVTSVMPEPGETLADFAGAEPAPWMEVGNDGTISARPETAAEVFLQGCDDPAIVAEAVRRLVPQSMAAFGQSPAAAAWRNVPSTYVVCTEDRGSSVAWQRERATRADHVIEIPTDHHPFLSRPQLFADLLARIALAAR
ncbi:alpha/beta fold hydrolase [Embleya sp. NPDC008237]|uniref:alpha/beta fold hydrolase n=1 Tax=Embleya sp. NPDC008237 TaxID=3363978 RepID=UPI0036E41E7A